jgi:iron(III) transport system substrate-binding protein
MTRGLSLGRGGVLLAALFTVLAAVGTGAAMLRPAQERLEHDAGSEGRLVIYSATDETQFTQILRAFKAAYPKVSIDYRSLPASEVYDAFKREADAGKPSADLLINSAMDLQIRLVNDRYAQSYASPERHKMPGWAVWKNEAFAVTAEPIVIGYNKRLLAKQDVPRTHDELAALLHRMPDKFRGRVGLYDPARSPTGFLYISQDVQIDRDSWDLISALGRAQPRLFVSTSDMMDRVSSGELLIAYNLIGSYALERAASDPDFGVIVPQDYVLLGSRVALIPRTASHPAAAKLFLDFMLSRHGQSLLGEHHMIPLRPDVARDDTLVTAGNVRAIHVGPALMAALDEVNRSKFLAKWRTSIDPAAATPGTDTRSTR